MLTFHCPLLLEMGRQNIYVLLQVFLLGLGLDKSTTFDKVVLNT